MARASIFFWRCVKAGGVLFAPAELPILKGGKKKSAFHHPAAALTSPTSRRRHTIRIFIEKWVLKAAKEIKSFRRFCF